MNLHDIRRDYHGDLLPENPDGFDPWELFARWLEEARGSEKEPTAMHLATVDQDGVPHSRVVLLKDCGPGLTFFTSHLSAKSRQLEHNPAVSAAFWWPSLMRQVQATGRARRLAREVVQAYFATRPRVSQIGAWASRQSEPLNSREDLKGEAAEVEARFAGREVECPPFWGGYVIDVTRFEFWQGQPGRLHDRFQSVLDGDGWVTTRLQP